MSDEREYQAALLIHHNRQLSMRNRLLHVGRREIEALRSLNAESAPARTDAETQITYAPLKAQKGQSIGTRPRR